MAISISDSIDALASYVESYQVIRAITGVGEGKGAFITLSDGIGGLSIWAGLLPNADRVAIDTHPYFAFDGEPNTDPVNVAAPDGQMGGVWPGLACSTWQASTTTRCATIVLSFPSLRLTNLLAAKLASVLQFPESIATASTIVAFT